MPGNGRAIFLGLSWLHAMHEHHHLLAALLEDLGLHQKVSCTNPNLWTSLWTAGDRSLLFILNLFTGPLEAELRVLPAQRSIPVYLGKRTIPPMTVISTKV